MFVPLGTKDIPVNSEELVELRRTEVTFEDGTTQTLEDNWRTTANPTLVLDPKQTWTGKTIFELKPPNPERRLCKKTNTEQVREPELKIVSQGTSASSSSTSRKPSERREGLPWNVEFKSEQMRSLVLKLWKEPDPDTGLARMSDTWHKLPTC